MSPPKSLSKSFARRKNSIQNCVRILVAANALWLSTQAHAEDPIIVVGTNTYSAYRTDLAPAAWVYVDADSAGATPVRAMPPALGHPEVDYKTVLARTRYFSAV